jgi:ATP-binding cassette subfamily F protein 3
MEYFAQDEAVRLDPAKTVYETLEAGSATSMVPAIRNILGGFLFSGDDVNKRAAVLSGGERTRLAVARMLLRSSNTLLMDEPTNHLDLDSKDVLLDALADYGGTLIIVSHDRYFVERLATKIVEVGHERLTVYPGTYAEFLWSKEHGSAAQTSTTTQAAPKVSRQGPGSAKPAASSPPKPEGTSHDREARKQLEADRRRKQREQDQLRKRIADLETRIAEREAEVRTLEQSMAAPTFYDEPEKARAVIDRHQTLMWEVGDLMGQWEALQEHAAETTS